MQRHSATTRRIGGGVFFALVVLLLMARVTQAHALLERSTPAANAELGTAPATIELWFSEPLEPQFSTAYLVDAAGNQFGRDAASVDTADPTHLTLTLPMLSPNIYTVVYRTLSQADGHEWLGSFPLTVLNPDGTRPVVAQANATSAVDAVAQGEIPGPAAIISRWLALLGALLLLGGLIFQRAVLPKNPALDHVKVTAVNGQELWGMLQRAIRLNILIGVSALLLGSWLQWAMQAFNLGGRGTLLELIVNTRSGNLLLYRQLLAVVLLAITVLATGRDPLPAGVGQWLALLLSMAILATFSLGSHAAAASGSSWAILGDFIHLVAVGVWLGGLLLLAAVLWQLHSQPVKTDAKLLRQIVQRFSALAMLAVFMILSSGLFTSLIHLSSWAALWQTTYGWLLLAKIILFGLMLGIALLNHRLVRAQAVTTTVWTSAQYHAFLRQVGGEALVSLVLMLVVAALVQTPPPTATPTAVAAPPPGQAFIEILTADDLSIHMQITPNQVGNNYYVTHLFHEDGSAIGEVQLVRLQFVHQTAALGQANLDLPVQGEGAFAAEGAYFNQAGPWNVTVYVRRRGMDDALAQTTVNVPAPVNTASKTVDPWQNPITALPGDLVIGGVFIGLLIAFFLWRNAWLNYHEPTT